MSRFFHAARLTELTEPVHVQPFLAEPEKHWRKGYSACELATSWISADDIPAAVRTVLETCPDFHGARLIEGFFERETDLRTRGRPSQTDLLVLAWTGRGLAVIGVEGKVAEPFGELVCDWNKSEGKTARLTHLCGVLGLEAAGAASLRYQLIHRTAAVLFEAERYRAADALMLVHSFSASDASLADFVAFAEAIGIKGAGKNAISEQRDVGGIRLRLGWVADRTSP